MSCTAFFASNDPWHEVNKLRQRWFTRRKIVLTIKRLEAGQQLPQLVFSNHGKSKVLTECIYLRLSSDKLIITARDALITLFGIAVQSATRGIIVDFADNFIDSMVATYAICMAGFIDYDRLISLISVMSPDIIATNEMGMQAIKGITPREDYHNPELHNHRLIIKSATRVVTEYPEDTDDGNDSTNSWPSTESEEYAIRMQDMVDIWRQVHLNIY